MIYRNNPKLIDLYSPEGHGTYLGQYGYAKSEQGKFPTMRVDKAKQAFYKKLEVGKEVHRIIKLYNWIKKNV